MRRRPSPAIVVAILALVAALGGTALAGSKINGKKIKKESISGNRLKDDTVTGTQVDESTLGKVPSATNADTVGGQTPAQVGSHAFSVTKATQGMPAGPGTTTAETLDLPAGTYFIEARGELNNNDAAGNDGLSCNLIAGANTAVIARNLKLGANNTLADDFPASGQLVHTFAAAGAARIDCVRDAGWVTGNVLDPTISAVSVQP